jgi:hypothetical protein
MKPTITVTTKGSKKKPEIVAKSNPLTGAGVAVAAGAIGFAAGLATGIYAVPYIVGAVSPYKSIASASVITINYGNGENPLTISPPVHTWKGARPGFAGETRVLTVPIPGIDGIGIGNSAGVQGLLQFQTLSSANGSLFVNVYICNPTGAPITYTISGQSGNVAAQSIGVVGPFTATS